MDFPAMDDNEQGFIPSCLDISPERLNGLSPSELADAMEEALDFMTEDTYDPGVINAYLDALDRASSIPEHPGAEDAFEDFKLKLKRISTEDGAQERSDGSRRASRPFRVWRTGFAAALLLFVLFGGMIIAQAFGVDVFGAIARWTEEAFSFGELTEDEAPNNPSDDFRGWKHDPETTDVKVSEDYMDLKAALDERGLPFRAPVIPEGFEVADSLLYIVPTTKNVEFLIAYTRGNDAIKFEVVQFDERPKTVHEKDKDDPEEYKYNNIIHYLFENAGKKAAVWVIDNLEYSLSTNSNTVNLKQLIQSFYEV